MVNDEFGEIDQSSLGLTAVELNLGSWQPNGCTILCTTPQEGKHHADQLT